MAVSAEARLCEEWREGQLGPKCDITGLEL